MNSSVHDKLPYSRIAPAPSSWDLFVSSKVYGRMQGLAAILNRTFLEVFLDV